MPTGQSIIDKALITMSILDQGGSASESDSQDALNELNDMWTSWGVDEGLIWTVKNMTYAMSAGKGSYTFAPEADGAAPDFISQIPGKIYDAYFTIFSSSSASSVLITPVTLNTSITTILDGNVATMGTLTVAGISAGSVTTTPGTTIPLPFGIAASCAVSSDNTVTFTAENLSGGSVALAANTWDATIITVAGESSIVVSAVFQPGTAALSAVSSLVDGGVVDIGVISVPGALVGAPTTSPSYSGGALPSRVILSAKVSAVGQVTISARNLTGAAVAIPALTYSVIVIGQALANAGQSRNQLNIVQGRQYYSHRDLSSTAYVPDEFYFDYDPDRVTGYATGYVWPVSTAFPATLELVIGVPFAEWTLTDNYNIPRNYVQDIVKALAFQLLPSYGAAVNDGLSQLITAQGEKAELRIREWVKFTRQLQPGTEMLEPPQQPKQVA